MRRDALVGLRELNQSHPISLRSALGTVIRHLSCIFLDPERTVRHAAHLLLKSMLPSLDVSQLAPFSALLFTGISCGLTHIAPSVQLDMLKVTGLFLAHCPSLVRQNAALLLPLYLPLISHVDSSSERKDAQLNSAPRSILSLRSSRVEVLKQLLEFLVVVTTADENSNSRPSIVIDPCKRQAWTSSDGLPLTVPVDLLEYLSTSTLLLHLRPKHPAPNLQGSGVLHKGHPSLLNRGQFAQFAERVVPVLMEFWLEVVPTVAVQSTRKRSHSRNKDTAACEHLQLILELLCLVLRLSLRQDCHLSLEAQHWWVLSQRQLSNFDKHLMAFFPISYGVVSQQSFSSTLQFNLVLCELMLLAHSCHSHARDSLSAYNGDCLQVVFDYLIAHLPSCSSAFSNSVQFADFVSRLVSSLDVVLQSPLLSSIPDRILMQLLSAVTQLFSACHPFSAAKHHMLVFVDKLLLRAITHPLSVR